MSDLPDRPRGGTPGVPAPRRLSNEEFELVIRRAAELQARAADAGLEGVPEDDVLRIGRELGLSPAHLRQALAEVHGAGPAERGVMARWLGPLEVRAGRTIRRDADAVRRRLEEHLLHREYMAVLRRLPDRTLYTRAAGVAAQVGRAMSQAFNRSPPLRASNLAVAVQPLEEGYSHVVLSTEMGSARTGWAAGGALGGGGAATGAAVALGIAVAPPAALLGLPLLAGGIYGARLGFEAQVRRARTELEALLDRLEHGELSPPRTRGPRPL